MDIPKYFSNVVLAQFKATGIPLKVYVNGEYLIIVDMYDISDPMLGSGMTEDGHMVQFDYRMIDHLLVGGNVLDLETYTKAMTGDTPDKQKEKEEEEEGEGEEEETKEESVKLGEITKDVKKARQKALDAEEKALKDKQKALDDEPITEKSVNKDYSKMHNVELNATYKKKFGVKDTKGLTRDELIKRLESLKEDHITESPIKKDSYVTNKDGKVGRVDNISGDREIADIRYNDGKIDSLPTKDLKIFETNYTFGIGDIVKNKNTSCPHYGSIGSVKQIMDLPDTMGKVVKYIVMNQGDNFRPGDSLTKTIDQLEPMN